MQIEGYADLRNVGLNLGVQDTDERTVPALKEEAGARMGRKA